MLPLLDRQARQRLVSTQQRRPPYGPSPAAGPPILPKIRVNTLSPGPIATPIFGKIGLSEQQAQEFGASIVQSVPMGRTGTPEEIASAVLFLASNESSYISGIELAVDGGMAQV